VVGSRGSIGSTSSKRSRGLALYLVLLAACSYIPARREMEQAGEVLGKVDSVAEVSTSCGGTFLATDGLCTDVTMRDGAHLRFEHVGFNSFGSTAVNVFVSEAGGLVPRVAGCEGIGPPNFHRDSPLGHHFRPTLIDVKDAAFRYREVLEAVEFWPQCPQYYEVQDRRGQHFRYCARRKGAAEEPPRPPCSR
jgi:hypothetical protein